MSARNNIKLSKIGQIINTKWNNIKNNHEDVDLDQYTIMPNHIHGILIINKRADARPAPTARSNQNVRLNAICEYIFNNPENWEEDIDNLMNL